MLFGCHDSAGISRNSTDRIPIDGLYGMNLENSSVNSFPGKNFGCGHTSSNHAPTRDETYIFSFAPRDCLTYLQCFAFLMNSNRCTTAYAHCYWSVFFCHQRHKGRCLSRIRRHYQGHSRQRSKNGDIAYGVVRRTVFIVR